MFRRSRFGIRPNVAAAGRTSAAAAPQEPPSAPQETSEPPKDVNESSTVTENKTVVTPAASGDGTDQNGEGTSASAAVQRRKRFSIKPKVAPGRLSTLSRTPRSPAKAASEAPVESTVSDLQKPTTSSQTGTTPSLPGLRSPRRRRPSEDSRQPKVQPKPTITSPDSSGPVVAPSAEDLQEQTQLPTDTGKRHQSTSDTPVKEAPPAPTDKVPPSLPDKEASEISEKAKTLISSKSSLSASAPAFSLSRLLNDPSDMQRIVKAQKLRELLRQEMHKEKHKKKAKLRTKEFSLDPTKMTMRDLIRYLPESNPMPSSITQTVTENETVEPPSPGRPESPEKAQEPAAVPKLKGPAEGGQEAPHDDQADNEDEEEESLMVPQVKVAEDGTLIIDEESLTVEVQRTKGQNTIEDRDPIFERGSTTTYASFRKSTHCKPWSSEETDMFFLAISMVGTDFSMISQLFPHRARSEIRNKFKKEERINSWRVDKAFRERRKLDIEYFSKLLEKILEVQKTRKKLKSLANKTAPKKEKRKRKTTKSENKLSDIEEDEDAENDMPDLEGEGEKENEEGSSAAGPKKKRRKQTEIKKEGRKNKKNLKAAKGSEQDDAGIPEDAEAALPEDHTNLDISEKTGDANAAKTTIKPAKLSRGRAPKPLLPLGRKYNKKPPTPSTKTGDATPDQDQDKKDTSPLKQSNKKKVDDDDISSEEEEATFQPSKPTRYGRMPKPTKPLNYPTKEDTRSSSPESTSKPKATAKRGRPPKAPSAQESKKPKLVTLRASQSDYSDEDEENQRDYEGTEKEPPACESSNDGAYTAFVPISLRSPDPVVSEVEETMEELDILANMPDVLGISQDALCPDASCEQGQHDTSTAEACEHQLDLLVDVIDFLSSEHINATEDDSYNEAAQTLLTIGHMAHLSQPAHSQMTTQVLTAETTSVTVTETRHHIEVEIASQPAAVEYMAIMASTSAHGDTVTSETGANLELQQRTTDNEDTQNQQSCSDIGSSTEVHKSPEGSKTESLPPKRGRLSRVKPKPNVGRASRAAQFETSTADEGTAEESHKAAPSLSQPSETLQAASSEDRDLNCSQVNKTKEGASEWDKSPAATPKDITSGSPVTIKMSTDAIMTSDSVDTVSDRQSSEPSTSNVVLAGGASDCQKQESEVASVSPTKRSRFQKVKPKPNLALTSRTAHSKPQTSTETVEKDSSQAPTPKLNEKPMVEASTKPSTSPDKPNLKAGPGSVSTPAWEMCSVSPVSLESPTEIKKPVVGSLCDKGDLGSATTDQSTSENQSSSESQSKISPEQATKETRAAFGSIDTTAMSNVGTSDADDSNLMKPNSVATESEAVQVSNSDSIQVTPLEVLPVSQTQESKVSSPQPRRGRLAKAKPNISQTSRVGRSKTETTKVANEIDVNSTLIPKTSDKEIVDASSELSTSILKTSESHASCSVSTPPLKLGSSCTLLKEQLATEEKVAGFAGGEEGSGMTSLDQNASENQKLPEPYTAKASEDNYSTSGSTDDKLTSNVETSGNDNSSLQKSDPILKEPRTEDPVQVVPAEGVPLSQKQEGQVKPSLQLRRGRFQKPKPNVAQASRAERSKPHATEETVAKDLIATPVLKTGEKPVVEALAEASISPEKPSQIPGSGLFSTPALESGSAPSLPMELPTTGTITPSGGSVGDQGDLGMTSLDQFTSEKQDFQTVQSLPSTEQDNKDTKNAPESLVPNFESPDGKGDPLQSDSVVTETQAERGSNTDSGQIIPSEVLPVNQAQESQVVSSPQARRSRFQKPKPNIALATRAVHSKTQKTKETEEEDETLTPLSKTQEKPRPDTSAGSFLSPEKPSQSTWSDSVSTPALESGCERTQPTEQGVPATSKPSQGAAAVSLSLPILKSDSASTLSLEIPVEEKIKSVGYAGGSGESELASPDLSSSENQRVPESQSKPCKREASKDTADSGDSSLLKSDSEVTKLPTVKPPEDDPVSPKQKSHVASSSQAKRSRFAKAKPNVIIASRGVRSKPQATKEIEEKDSNLTSNLEVPETTTDASIESACSSTTKDPKQGIDPALESLPSLDSGSTCKLTEQCATVDLKTQATGDGSQFKSDDLASEPRPSEKVLSSKAEFESQGDTGTLSQPTMDNQMSCAETTESSSCNLQTILLEVEVLEVKQGSDTDSTPAHDQGDHPASCVPQDSSVVQKPDGEVASSPQPRRSRFQRVKPKPNVALSSRNVRPKLQTTTDTCDKDSTPTVDPKICEQTMVDTSAEPSTSTGKPRNRTGSATDLTLSLEQPSTIYTEPQMLSNVMDSSQSPNSTEKDAMAEFVGEPACAQSSDKTNQSTCLVPDDTPPGDFSSALSPMDSASVTEKKEADVQDLGHGTVVIGTIGSSSVAEACSSQKPAEELSSSCKPVADAGPDSGSETLKQNVRQRRQHFPKVKPNIGATVRGRQTKTTQSDDIGKSEHHHTDSTAKRGAQRELESTEKDPTGLTQSSSYTDSSNLTNLEPVQSETSVSSDSVLETKTAEEATPKGKHVEDHVSTSDKLEAGSASTSDHKKDTSVEATEQNIQATAYPTLIPHAESSEDGSQKSEESTQLPQLQSQEVQHHSETAAQGTPVDHLKVEDSTKPVKPPQSRRGRTTKPKPNLGRSRQPPQPQQVQEAKQAGAAEDEDATVLQQAQSEVQPDIQEQVLSQFSDPSPSVPPSVAGSASSVSEAPDSSAQSQAAALPGTEESASQPGFSIFPDMLPGQISTDPEQFFILSLTEIPVDQVLDSVSEPLPYLPETDASVQQQQSDPGEQVASAGGGALSHAADPGPVEESNDTDVTVVQDPEPETASSITENQEDPQGTDPSAVQPSTATEVVIGEDTETPPSKGTLKATTRRAKQQAKTNTSKRKQAKKTVEEEEESAPLQTNTTETLELPGLSLQSTDSFEQEKKGGSRRNTAKKAVLKEPEESSSTAQTSQRRSTRTRKPKDSPPGISTPPVKDPGPSKEASKSQKVKTPRVARKQPASEPVASTSHDVALTYSSEQAPEGSSSAFSITELNIDNPFDQALTFSQSSIELFSSQHSLDGSTIEEATSVSQYFLSDIFTDVEEG